MTILQVGDKYQVVWNGSEWVITYTDDVALADGDTIHIGFDPEEAASGATFSALTFNLQRRIAHTNIRR